MDSLEVRHVCVIASVVDIVFRLDICMSDASRNITVEIYTLVFPIHPSANSRVTKSSSSTATVECNASRCRRPGTEQCYSCKGIGWCRRHINNIRWVVPGRFYPVCDRCRRLFMESETEPDTPPKALPPPKKRRRSQYAASESVRDRPNHAVYVHV